MNSFTRTFIEPGTVLSLREAANEKSRLNTSFIQSVNELTRIAAEDR